MWPLPNFQPPDDSRWTYKEPNGTCEPLGRPANSYVANYGEGYWYATTNCTGSPVKAFRQGTKGNIGFPARSLKWACVSCRTAN